MSRTEVRWRGGLSRAVVEYSREGGCQKMVRWWRGGLSGTVGRWSSGVDKYRALGGDVAYRPRNGV